MTAHEIHALSGAYAMDALDDIERARFEAHLSACAECQAEVASLQDTAALFSTMSRTAPPAAMRDKILADIKNVRPLPPLVARVEAKAPRRPRRWSGFVAAAAVLGIVGGGFSVWQQTHDNTSATTLSAARQVMTAADVTKTSKNIGNGATVTVYRSESLGKAALKTDHLPTAPAGKVYQLWLQDPTGHMVDAGLLTKSGNREVVLDGDASKAIGAGITIEKVGGSETPTIPAYAIVPFESST